MGTDIHAMIEVKTTSRKFPQAHFLHWVNAGDPIIERDYILFSILGNVRNDHRETLPFIGQNRLRVNTSDRCFSVKIDNDYQADIDLTPCTEFYALHEHYGDDAHSSSFVTLKELQVYKKLHGGSFVSWLIEKMIKNAASYGVKNPEYIRLVFFFDN